MKDVIRVHRDIIGREIKVGSIVAGLAFSGIMVGKVEKFDIDRTVIKLVNEKGLKYEVSPVNAVLIDDAEYFHYILTRKTS